MAKTKQIKPKPPLKCPKCGKQAAAMKFDKNRKEWRCLECYEYGEKDKT